MNENCILLNHNIKSHASWPEDLQKIVSQALYAAAYIDTLNIWFPVRDTNHLPFMNSTIKEKFSEITNFNVIPIAQKEKVIYKMGHLWYSAGIIVIIQQPTISELEKISKFELPLHTISRCDFAFDVGFAHCLEAQEFQHLWLKISKVSWSRDIESFSDSVYSGFQNNGRGNSTVMYSDKEDRVLRLGYAAHWEFRSKRKFLVSKEINENTDISKILDKSFIIDVFNERVIFYDFKYDYIDSIISKKYKDKLRTYKEIKRRKKINASAPSNRPYILYEYLEKIKGVLKEAGIQLSLQYYLNKTRIENVATFLLTC